MNPIEENKAMFGRERTREDQFLLAANALLLTRAGFLIYYHECSTETRKTLRHTDRADWPSFVHLRDQLTGTGLIDRRIEPVFSAPRPMPNEDPELLHLLESEEPVARISFGDVPFTAEDWVGLETASGRQMSWLELKMPICNWMVGEVVWKSREIVADFFKSRNSEMLSREHPPLPSLHHLDQRQRESSASRALTSIHDRTTTRPIKETVIQALVGFLGSKKAAERAWEAALVANWKLGGARAVGTTMTRSQFEAELARELGDRPYPES